MKHSLLLFLMGTTFICFVTSKPTLDKILNPSDACFWIFRRKYPPMTTTPSIPIEPRRPTTAVPPVTTAVTTLAPNGAVAAQAATTPVSTGAAPTQAATTAPPDQGAPLDGETPADGADGAPAGNDGDGGSANEDGNDQANAVA